jgi:hypothetical protein
MGHLRVLNWLLSLLTWTDGILAVALASALAAWASRYRRVVPPPAYKWGFALGVALSLAWWALAVVGLYVLGQEGAFVAVTVSTMLPAAILGAEAGAAGFILLTSPWRVCSLAFGALSGLLALTVAGLLIRVRLPP